jgi:mono/diheme cytochrome c family protein
MGFAEMNGPHSTWRRAHWGVLMVAGLSWAATEPILAQEVLDRRPTEVTDSAIAVGRVLFRGAANCAGCHGAEGRGSKSGPDLTDRAWLHGDGSYRMISKLILHGVTRYESTQGKPMPMRGWAPVNDDEVRAVAAYVWSIGWKARGGSEENARNR